MDLTFLPPLVYLAWLLGAVAFVLGLIRMNSPATARNGNLVSAAGMALAIGATAVLLLLKPDEATHGAESAPGFNAVGWLIILAGIALGGGFGLYTARTVKMTAMPQLVSLFNAVGGGAAALIAIDEYLKIAGEGVAPTLIFNVATASILLGLDAPGLAARSFGVDTATGELQIWSQPWEPPHDWEDYQRFIAIGGGEARTRGSRVYFTTSSSMLGATVVVRF